MLKAKKRLTVGTLIYCEDVEFNGDLIESMRVVDEIIGDSTKPKLKVVVGSKKIGELVDGVPIMGFGKEWAEKGQKVCYAYF